MLGPNHYKKKIDKEARKAAKKQSAADPKKVKQQQQNSSGTNGGAAASPGLFGSGPQKPPQQRTRNNSTLKGPVVSHNVAAVRDSANDKKKVPFTSKKEEYLYNMKHRIFPTDADKKKDAAAAAAAPKPSSGSSKAQRRPFARSRGGDDLLDQFRKKLQSSTFRLLNEQIYSSPNAFASQMLRDAATFEDYHRGYRQQLVQWPMNPNQIITEALLGDKRGRFLANKAKSMPGYIPPSWVIADMGCGDATIAAALKPKQYTVHSFDFCAVNENVTIADSSNVPLEANTVDICIFSLSLMATDYFQNLLEAYRILKPKRLLKIVEVRSRIPNPNMFAELVEGIGFTCDWYDVAGDYFIAFDFLKNDGEKGPNTRPRYAPGDVLLPSLYKKR